MTRNLMLYLSKRNQQLVRMKVVKKVKQISLINLRKLYKQNVRIRRKQVLIKEVLMKMIA